MKLMIDLNCDIGESFGVYEIGFNKEVIKYISSANIACGYHAGDPMVMQATVKLAADHSVGIGAHPSYPDLMGFGRRKFECSAEEIRNYVIYQVGALKAFCDAEGVKLRHVKPHGSLYHLAMSDRSVAKAVAEAVASIDNKLIYVALPGSKGHMAAVDAGLRVICEAFPDRAYLYNGKLAPRNWPDSVISDPKLVAQRALEIVKRGRTSTLDGMEIPIAAQTLCVHSDTPNAVQIAKEIKETLLANGIDTRPME